MAEQQSTQEDSSTEYMLTTIDNPFNPFEEWDEWYAWDARAGYHTPSFLARITIISDELSEPDRRAAMQSAIEEAALLNVTGVYLRVQASDFPSK